MKRFHLSVGVADLDQSIEFYRTLFGEEPAVVEHDYAKWMLEDPRLNFSINAGFRRGVNHVGLQAETLEELGEITARLEAAQATVRDEPSVECCYARSTKAWVQDPDRLQWETFVTHGPATQYGGGNAADINATQRACCG